MLISFVIPVYNSGQTIGLLVEMLIREITPVYEFEIILVNDASTDNSREVCIGLVQQYKTKVRFFNLAKNFGEHNAVLAGLNQASGDYTVILDDDLQNPVSEVIKLINYAKGSSYDVVYTYYDEKRHSRLRNMGSWLNDRMANWMLNKPKDLYLSSFKILNRFLVGEIIKYSNPYPYLDGILLQITANIGKFKVEHHERRVGKSGYTFKKLFALWMNMFTNFSILPLRISMFLGFIVAIVGFLIGLYSVYEKFTNPAVPSGYTLMIFIITFFSGIQLIAIGMVGEYLGRIFISINKKPQFVIKETFE